MQWLKNLFGFAKPAPAPAPLSATLQRGPDGIFELRISGVLNKATVDKIQSFAATEINRGATDLKMLMVLKEFRGWKRGDDWGDLDFFAEHEHNIAKIAVAGDLRWKEETLLFLAAGRRTGQVRFFASHEEDKAKAWLAD